ncbi:MAG: FtsX-like permease family protein, partial [Oligoflexus sp.]
TMRAIGAQKSFVVGMFLAETAITGMIGALLGTLLALSVLIFLGWKGIPATTDVVTFLFSGPRLHPKLHPWILTLSPIVIVIVATLASIYAARHAAHIQPAEAMQEKE